MKFRLLVPVALMIIGQALTSLAVGAQDAGLPNSSAKPGVWEAPRPEKKKKEKKPRPPKKTKKSEKKKNVDDDQTADDDNDSTDNGPGNPTGITPTQPAVPTGDPLPGPSTGLPTGPAVTPKPSAKTSKGRKPGAPAVVAEKGAKRFSGNASWYGIPFHGRKTASGEIFDMNKLSAAHRTFPLPTYALIEDPRTGNVVVVKVNDRGPYAGHRVMDLSREAARQLGTMGRGVFYIEGTVIGKHTPGS